MKDQIIEPSKSTIPFTMDNFFLIRKKIFSKSECQEILNEFKSKKHLTKKNKRIVEGVNKTINELLIESNLGDFWEDLNEKLNEFVTPAVEDYLKKFNTVNSGNYEYNSAVIWSQENMDYSPIHYDKEWITLKDGEQRARNFLCLLYLDDDYDGGEVMFPLQMKVVKPEAGMLLIFPTSYMFPHNTTPVLGESRHLIRMNYVLDKNSINEDSGL